MDAFEFDNNALKPHYSQKIFHCLPKIKNLFRITEILVLLFFFTSVSTRLPSAIKLAAVYLRLVISVVVSPLFIFLLSNVIALTLFFKSRRHFPEHSQISLETHLEFCQELVSTNGNDHCTHFTYTSFQLDEVVFQDKQTIVEVTRVSEEAHSRSDSSENFEKVLEEDNCDGRGKQPHSLEAETRRRRVAAAGEVNKLSNEEFQRAIEAFIAKQIKFHHEEEVHINVLHGCA